MVAVGVSVVHIPRKRQYGTQRLCVPAQLELKDWTSLPSMRRRNIPLIYNKTQTIIQPLIKPSSPIPVLAVQYAPCTTKALTTYNKVDITIGHRQMVPIFLIRLIAKHEHKSNSTLTWYTEETCRNWISIFCIEYNLQRISFITFDVLYCCQRYQWVWRQIA